LAARHADLAAKQVDVAVALIAARTVLHATPHTPAELTRARIDACVETHTLSAAVRQTAAAVDTFQEDFEIFRFGRTGPYGKRHSDRYHEQRANAQTLEKLPVHDSSPFLQKSNPPSMRSNVMARAFPGSQQQLSGAVMSQMDSQKESRYV
jgi:hypothetical protein